MRKNHVSFRTVAALTIVMAGLCRPAMAASDTAHITLTGTVRDNTCTLDNSAPSFTLPEVSVRDFGSQANTKVSSFTVPIKLTGCGAGATTVTLTTTGTADTDGGASVFANTSTVKPAATGVGLLMFRSGGSSSIFDTAGRMQDTVTLTPGTDNLMEFSVRYVSTKNTVTPGSFKTVISMRINYN